MDGPPAHSLVDSAASSVSLSPSFDINALRTVCITPGLCRERYDFGRKVGSGKFGTVRLATCRGSGRQVAVKSISKRAFADPQQLATLFNEIAIMKKISALKHKHLVEFLDAFEEQHYMHIVMNFCEGGELFDGIVKRGHYSEQSAAQIMKMLLGAIQALHKNGVIHRDLKPENCLLVNDADDADVQITDFGLSRDNERGDLTTALVGTMGYVAPEVIVSLSYTPACDVWSLGVILYILLAGYPPFYGPKDFQLDCIRKGIFEFHADRWVGISDDAKDLVRKMLTVAVESRITVEAALVHPFITGSRSDIMMSLALQNMRLFNARRKLRAVAMASVLSAKFTMRMKLRMIVPRLPRLSPAEIEALMTEFRRVSVDGVLMDLDGLQSVLDSIGLSKLPAKRLFMMFDENGDGEIDYREFVCGMVSACTDTMEAVKLCFKVYDKDDNGYISRDELGSMLSIIGVDETSSAEQQAVRLEEVFDALDTNADGQISYDEFREGLVKHPTLAPTLLGPVTPRTAGSPVFAEKSDAHAACPSASAPAFASVSDPMSGSLAEAVASVVAVRDHQSPGTIARLASDVSMSVGVPAMHKRSSSKRGRDLEDD